MTEYKGIKGGKVRNFDTDPDNPYVGQVWYNQTLGDLRVRATTLTSAWASGGNLNTARFGLGGAGADNTSALAFTGRGSSFPTLNTETESYDGTTWTEVNDVNTATYYVGGAGTQTAALKFGGRLTPGPASASTESWNGTSWTAVNDLNTGKYGLGGAGTQTSALAFGGFISADTAQTESWNGTSWTELNDLNTARRYLGGAGEDLSLIHI